MCNEPVPAAVPSDKPDTLILLARVALVTATPVIAVLLKASVTVLCPLRGFCETAVIKL